MRFIFIILSISAIACRAEQPLVGRWEGSIKIPERELKLIVDLAQSNNGGWSGSLILPGLDVKGSALADISVNGSAVSFALKSVNGRGLEATFNGNLSNDGILTGDFVQAGNKTKFSLNRIGPPQVEPAAHSTSIAREFEGEWKGEYELLGYARHVTLKLANRGGDGASAEFGIVGKKVNNLPVDLIEQEGALVSINSSSTGISYEGRLNKETNEIQGTLVQGPIEVALALHHAK
jgi:hypothetical protein